MKGADPRQAAGALRRFEEIAELEGAQREAALARLAAEDAALAAAVSELLAADAAAGESFLGDGVGGFAPALVTEALEAESPGGVRSGDRLGAWRLARPLGRGGMGEVWEAERADGQFHQTAALKLLKRGMDSEEVLARFRRERQILARLEHPGIARLLDGGIAPDGRPYFVLEKVEGESITVWCEARSSSVGERVRLVVDVADSVAVAHRNLVVHRDLKPSNVLIDGAGRPKLLDFGIAKLLGDDGEPGADRTRLEARAMTPAYAAPEQIRGEAVTTATDVYALGVMLYELLTGRLPHDRRSDSVAALSEQLERETLTRPSRVVTERGEARKAKALAGDLDTIVLRALARDPERRYESASAFADDLRRYLDGRPVRARPDSGWYRTAKFVARHRVAVVAGIAGVVALIAAAVFAQLQAVRSERSALEARTAATRAERVRGFLVSVFDAADPARTRGERIEPRLLVDEGVRRAASELAGEPALGAEMDDVFAGLYRKLGVLDAALPLAERSLASRTAIFGSESVEAARSEWTLGWVQLAQGDFANAKLRLEHAIAALDRVEGPRSLTAADAREPLMELTFASEGGERTLAVVEQRLATYREVLGGAHEKTALSLSDLGVVLHELGRTEEAEKAYRESLAILDAKLAPDDLRRAFPYSNLSALLRDAGRLAEAESTARTALGIRRKVLGNQHPETAMTLSILSRALIDLGRLDEAEAVAREALAIVEGKDRFSALQARAVLAMIRRQQGHPAEALELIDVALPEHLELLPPDHVLVSSLRIQRALTLLELGRPSEAEREIAPVIERLRGQGPALAEMLENAEKIAREIAAAR